MSLWIPHQKKEGARHAIQHYCRVMTCSPTNHWQVTLPFCFNYSHVFPINHCYVQRIVRVTSPQSMNVGDVVWKLWTISVIQGQQCYKPFMLYCQCLNDPGRPFMPSQMVCWTIYVYIAGTPGPSMPVHKWSELDSGLPQFCCTLATTAISGVNAVATYIQ